MRKIEEGYKVENEYHNAIHAASVLHSVHRILVHARVVDSISTDVHSRALNLLVSYIAAVVHDYRHAGVTNNFLIDTASPTAILYNDASPHENMHSASAFQLIMDERYNFINSFSKDEARTFRNHVITMVLHTDMQQHFPLLSRFKMRIGASRRASAEFDTVLPPNDKDATLVLQMVLKVTDLSHLTYSFDLHKMWVLKLEAEMFSQGDLEDRMGLPRSAMCDREKPGISSSQTDFIEFVATGLLHAFSTTFPLTRPMMEALDRNHEEWERVNN